MNVDSYSRLDKALSGQLQPEQIITDPLRTLAYGNDASFYRLVPKRVIRTGSETEVVLILRAAGRLNIPITFRAAGTSLSGQAVTDGVLVVAGDGWQDHEILEDGRRIRLQPGIIGAQANRYLAPLGRKIGPDPASINAAMIGGIVANNASGMCCGTAQNSYNTVHSVRIILADGTLLDTGDEKSRNQFSATHGEMLEALTALSSKVCADHELADRIRHKFKIKNTTGYQLNALVDYEDPFDIINHLLIGSEGTLGFISEIVYDTVVEHPHKASALVIFENMHDACSATAMLKKEPVAAVELMDRASLRSVENKKGMPSYLKSLSQSATALLIESSAESAKALKNQIKSIEKVLSGYTMVRPAAFTDKAKAYTALWNIRKGLFPAVGAVRQTGTTVITEDVAFPIKHLAEATLELQRLLQKHHYFEAVIFGHALEGNLHFVFAQDFGRQSEIQRYADFMDELCAMVVNRYDGSLKAEHGTGRNMAPFVEMEWGSGAYELMQAVKALFDPKGLLNPGVILNPNPKIHLENLKPLPATHEIVDKCIECGFCEHTCPSKNVTLSPRQRITVQREISRLSRQSADKDERALKSAYAYQGDQTCAVDGLCQLNCPVEINTGELTKTLRHLELKGGRAERMGNVAASHFEGLTAAMGKALDGVTALHGFLGDKAMQKLAHTARRVSGKKLPLWNRFMPTGVKVRPKTVSKAGDTVVYFPACVSRTMGPAKDDPMGEPLFQVTIRLLERAGFQVVFPEAMNRLCCGQPFDTKGLFDQAQTKSHELESALLKVSDNGRIPVLCDTSPCLYRMRSVMEPRLKLFEPVEFIHDFLLDRLAFTPCDETVALHTTCSSRKMGLEDKFKTVAEQCAAKVIIPEDVYCCGFAGDKGFTHPELNASALKDLSGQVTGRCDAGYSNSRTCEVGLSLHSGLFYRSIVYVADRQSGPK